MHTLCTQSTLAVDIMSRLQWRYRPGAIGCMPSPSLNEAVADQYLIDSDRSRIHVAGKWHVDWFVVGALRLRSYQDGYRLVIVRNDGATLRGKQVVSSNIRYLTQSHYLHTEPVTPYPIQIISSAGLGSDRYQL